MKKLSERGDIEGQKKYKIPQAKTIMQGKCSSKAEDCEERVYYPNSLRDLQGGQDV